MSLIQVVEYQEPGTPEIWAGLCLLLSSSPIWLISGVHSMHLHSRQFPFTWWESRRSKSAGMYNLWSPSKEGIDISFFYLKFSFWEKLQLVQLGQVIIPTTVCLVRSEGTITLKHGFSHLNWVVRKGGKTVSKRRVECTVFQKTKQVSIVLSNFISHCSQLELSPLIVNLHIFLSSASILFSLDYLPALYGFEAPLPRRCLASPLCCQFLLPKNFH